MCSRCYVEADDMTLEIMQVIEEINRKKLKKHTGKDAVPTDYVKAPPHNSAARLAMSFPPSAACKFLDLHPVNLRNLHLHLTKNPFASRPPHLRGVTLRKLPLLRLIPNLTD